MWSKIWKNKIEFFPHFSLFFFWAACLSSAMLVQNTPGMMLLGLITIPPLILISIAAVRTYKELSQGSKISLTFTYSEKEPGESRKYMRAACGIVILIIIGSTYLHHFQPQVLRVPSNTDVSLWQNPTFENTVIYDRMIAAEREKVLKEGVPMIPDTNKLNDNPSTERKTFLKEHNIIILIFGDIILLLLGLICFLHARKHYGYWMAFSFLIGSFVFTGLQESIWILTGRFLGGPNILIQAEGTYWFTKGALWFFETPVMACIAWFFIAYSCVLVAGKVFPDKSLTARAAIGALIAVFIDLWQDPAVTSPETMQWVWAKGCPMLIFGIPDTNFLGWFLLIFVFALIWERLPEMEAKWGRFKTSNIFFVILFVSEIGILLIITIWTYIMRFSQELAGIKDGLQIPPGW